VKDALEKRDKPVARVSAPYESVGRAYNQNGESHYAGGLQKYLPFEFFILGGV
jgi:hypothetical protein